MPHRRAPLGFTQQNFFRICSSAMLHRMVRSASPRPPFSTSSVMRVLFPYRYMRKSNSRVMRCVAPVYRAMHTVPCRGPLCDVRH
eukprot:1017598-Rhodomonas_salina.1